MLWKSLLDITAENPQGQSVGENPQKKHYKSTEKNNLAGPRLTK